MLAGIGNGRKYFNNSPKKEINKISKNCRKYFIMILLTPIKNKLVVPLWYYQYYTYTFLIVNYEFCYIFSKIKAKFSTFFNT